jgi:asparagine synthase (glutamine-hydrolysing)
VKEIDPAAVLEFLEFGYVTDDRCIFRGASKLPAASILEWRGGGVVSIRQYWQMPVADEESHITFDEAVEETERLLLEAVRLRLQADVPIGALLSAGIDSTLVCWALAKLNANITAFTVSTPGDPADEAPAARETAKILGIPHQVVTLPPQGEGVMGQLTRAYAEPFGSQSAMAMLNVSGAVKPHATVLLTGDGGDDVFLGYEFHHNYLRTQRLARKLPGVIAPVWRGVVRPLVQPLPFLRRPKHALDYATGGLGAMTRAWDGLPFYQSRGLLGERLAGLELPQRQIPLSTDSARHMLRDMLNYQQRMWFVAHFMTKVDAATMFHALEARSPFLDHTVWDFAAKLPYELRLRGGDYKAVLREIVRRRISPEVARRRKQGFTVPIEKWMASDWSGVLDRLRNGSMLVRDGWLRPDSWNRSLPQLLATPPLPTQVWFLVVLENWMRMYLPQSK